MRILLASPEAVPFAKVGGLADVAGALPRALAALGHEVAVVLPRYRLVDPTRFGLQALPFKAAIRMGERTVEAGVLKGALPGEVPVYFVQQDAYYDRDGVYGTKEGDYPDNAERFGFYCRATLEVCRALGPPPDVLHCNDWQTSLLPVYLRTEYAQDPFYRRIATVLTIHNLGYQGLFPPEVMPVLGLPPDLFHVGGLEFYGQVNLLKGGLIFADLLNSVSRKYAEEIQTAEFGCGLEGVLQERRTDLHGILNGVDYEEWDPAHDPLLPARYDARDLGGKARCKAALQQECGLPARADVPLLAAIGRLADQKGFDLVAATLETLLRRDVQFVLLGTGEARYHELFEAIGRRHPDQAGIRLAFDNTLAHLIEAGADLFLMPSRYEPCGLNQMYSLRYGTIPLVRATGGLDDTIVDYDPATGEGTGFKFRNPDASSLLATIERALAVYADRAAWTGLIRRAMAQDFSWAASARQYVTLYQQAVARRAAAA